MNHDQLVECCRLVVQCEFWIFVDILGLFFLGGNLI